METLKVKSYMNDVKQRFNVKMAVLFNKEIPGSKELEDAMLRKQLKRLGKTEQEQRLTVEKLYRTLIFKLK